MSKGSSFISFEVNSCLHRAQGTTLDLCFIKLTKLQHILDFQTQHGFKHVFYMSSKTQFEASASRVLLYPYHTAICIIYKLS